MRKGSLFSRKRHSSGKLRFLAHQIANTKSTQLLSNGLLMKLLRAVGITEYSIYAKAYGKEFADMLFGARPTVDDVITVEGSVLPA